MINREWKGGNFLSAPSTPLTAENKNREWPWIFYFWSWCQKWTLLGTLFYPLNFELPHTSRIMSNSVSRGNFKSLRAIGWAWDLRLVLNPCDQLPFLAGARHNWSDHKKAGGPGNWWFFRRRNTLIFLLQLCFHCILNITDCCRRIRKELWPEKWSMQDRGFHFKTVGTGTRDCVFRVCFRSWRYENPPDCFSPIACRYN